MLATTHLDIFSDDPEREYIRVANQEHRRTLGQFFTPYPIAKFMANWVTSNPNAKRILDPAVGLGIFLRAIIEQPRTTSELIGYDIDNTILDSCNRILSHTQTNCNIKLSINDYMFNDWDNTFDGIICNPPYLKFHNFSNRERILEDFRRHLGMNLSGFTNLYTLFLLKAVHSLNPNGRAAFIIPSEFMNSDYGKSVKRYLISNKHLRYIILFHFTENVFHDAMTTASIFLFSNDSRNDSVEFITIDSVHQLDFYSDKLSSYPDTPPLGKVVPYLELDQNIKWRAYYQMQNGSSYHNLVPLSTYGKVVRGIATGDNDYFTFSLTKKNQFNIKDTYLLPCVTKSMQANSPFFTQEHFDRLASEGKQVFLLNATNPSEPYLKKYLQIGETRGVHQKYLTSHRTPWYSIENRPPAPIWVAVFNRGNIKFVRNETEARSLTTFHCIYLNIFSIDRADLLFAYLLTDVAKHIIKDNRREYGDGLEKFEPNDLNHAKVINLDNLTSEEVSKILSIYQSYRLSAISGSPNRPDLDELQILFQNILRRQ